MFDNDLEVETKRQQDYIRYFNFNKKIAFWIFLSIFGFIGILFFTIGLAAKLSNNNFLIEDGIDSSIAFIILGIVFLVIGVVFCLICSLIKPNYEKYKARRTRHPYWYGNSQFYIHELKADIKRLEIKIDELENKISKIK